MGDANARESEQLGVCGCTPVTDQLLHSMLPVQEFLVKRKQFRLAISAGEQVSIPSQIFAGFIITLHSAIDEWNITVKSVD